MAAPPLLSYDLSSESCDTTSAPSAAHSLAFFRASHAYARLLPFIEQLNRATTGITMTQLAPEIAIAHRKPEPPQPPQCISSLLSLLDWVSSLIFSPQSSAPSLSHSCASSTVRFANPAFRTFLAQLAAGLPKRIQDAINDGFGASASSAASLALGDSWGRVATLGQITGGAHGHGKHAEKNIHPRVLASLAKNAVHDSSCSSHSHGHDERACSSDEYGQFRQRHASKEGASPLERMAYELSEYLLISFGNYTRLDYGTGMELNFVCFLAGWAGLADGQDTHKYLALTVFDKYLQIVRRLQREYLLEPAGSRGVWGLDDYSFLPFLFGSAQLVGHKHIKPKSVRSSEILEGYAYDYMYLSSIQHILGVKSASFAEHSPMLNDLTIVSSWEKVNQGLWKMYKAEVLGKFAVVQHFQFSSFLSSSLVVPMELLPADAAALNEPPPCCSDAIRFPAALAAKQQ